MPSMEEFERELERVCGEIDRLREYGYRVETDLAMVRDRCGWLRALNLYWIARDLNRQIEQLKLRNNVVRNCYRQAQREERARLGRRSETPV